MRETGPMEWEQVEYKPKGDTKLNLPSSVFASNVEEDVGLLNKAAPQSGSKKIYKFTHSKNIEKVFSRRAKIRSRS